jgi:hypothetical protein
VQYLTAPYFNVIIRKIWTISQAQDLIARGRGGKFDKISLFCRAFSCLPSFEGEKRLMPPIVDRSNMKRETENVI